MRAVDVALLFVDGSRFGELAAGRGVEHAVDGPSEVHRGRAGGPDAGGGGGVRRAVLGYSRAASATPYAPKMPIAGAPRTANVAIAVTTVSILVGTLAHHGPRQRALIEIADGVAVVPDGIHAGRFGEGRRLPATPAGQRDRGRTRRPCA